MRRGDKLQDTDLGILTIDIIEELYDLGGAIIGWRIYTN